MILPGPENNAFLREKEGVDGGGWGGSGKGVPTIDGIKGRNEIVSAKIG